MLLEVKALEVHYGKAQAIKNASLNVKKGRIVTLIGANGAGKTTILRCISSLKKPTSGEIVFEGKNIVGFSLHEVVKIGVAHVPEGRKVFATMTVAENLQMGAYLRSDKRVITQDLEKIYNHFPVLKARSGQPAGSLSGGEQQMLATSRALMTNPKLLLMDEPLAALDINSKAEIYPFFDRLNQELAIPILYVSHSPDEVARLADHLVLMESGKILASGPIGKMLTRMDLPLAHSADAESIIEAKISGHDNDFQLTYLTFAGGQFTVAGTRLTMGETVRLRILARDVSLTLAHQTDTSILNIFPAVVEEIMEENPSQMTVRVTAQGVPILSRITRKSATTLGLEVGKQVYAQVKSVATLA